MISLAEIPPYIWAGLLLFFAAGLYFGQLISYYIQKKYTKEKIKLAIDMWSDQTFLYFKHNKVHLKYMSLSMDWFAKFTTAMAEDPKAPVPKRLYTDLQAVMDNYDKEVAPIHKDWGLCELELKTSGIKLDRYDGDYFLLKRKIGEYVHPKTRRTKD